MRRDAGPVACHAAILASALLLMPHPGVAAAADAQAGAKCNLSASLESGVKQSSEPAQSLLLKPKAAYLCKRSGSELEIKSGAVLDYRTDDGSWGESTADQTVSFERQIEEDITLTLDAAYAYARILDESISGARLTSDDHTIEASAGLEWEWEAFTLKFDAGAASELHGRMRREDGQTTGRQTQDYIEPEVALRISAGPRESWQPFIEFAYMGRHYFSDRSRAGLRRHMAGPEFIAGVQTERKTFEGQIAAILLARGYAEEGVDSPPVIGPYIDLTWKPDALTEITFAAAAQIDQEETGEIRGDPFYSAKLDVSYQAAERLKVMGSAGVEYDDDPGRGGTLTITPELKLTWQYRPAAALILGAGLSWERDGHMDETVSATLQAGWSISW